MRELNNIFSCIAPALCVPDCTRATYCNTHTFTLFLSSPSLCLSLSLPPFLSQFCCFLLKNKETRIHVHPYKHTNTHTHTLSLSLSLSFKQTQTHTRVNAHCTCLWILYPPQTSVCFSNITRLDVGESTDAWRKGHRLGVESFLDAALGREVLSDNQGSGHSVVLSGTFCFALDVSHVR